MAKEAAIFVQAPQETLPVDGRPMVKENAKRRVELDVDEDLISMCIFFPTREVYSPFFTLFSDSNYYNKNASPLSATSFKSR